MTILINIASIIALISITMKYLTSINQHEKITALYLTFICLIILITNNLKTTPESIFDSALILILFSFALILLLINYKK